MRVGHSSADLGNAATQVIDQPVSGVNGSLAKRSSREEATAPVC